MPEDVKDKSEVSEVSSAEFVKQKQSGNMTATLTKFAMIGIVVLVAVFAAYIITLKVLKPMMAQSPTPQVTQDAAHSGDNTGAEESSGHGGESDDGHGGGHGAEAASDNETQFYTIESIVVNPAGTAGTRFLSCSVSFEVYEKDDVKTFEALDIRLKDVLITILSSKTVEELSDIKSRNRMRREILIIANRLTKPIKAKAVYLTDFVLQ